MKAFLAVCLLVGIAFGQGFSQLATNRDGSVLYFSITSLFHATKPLINDSATLIFYESVAGSPAMNELFAFSVSANTLTGLAIDAANSPGFGASISDDGSEVAFLYGPNRQAYVIKNDGTGLRQITNFMEPLTELEMSGDGSVVFAITAKQSHRPHRCNRRSIGRHCPSDTLSPDPGRRC